MQGCAHNILCFCGCTGIRFMFMQIWNYILLMIDIQIYNKLKYCPIYKKKIMQAVTFLVEKRLKVKDLKYIFGRDIGIAQSFSWI